MQCAHAMLVAFRIRHPRCFVGQQVSGWEHTQKHPNIDPMGRRNSTMRQHDLNASVCPHPQCGFVSRCIGWGGILWHQKGQFQEKQQIFGRCWCCPSVQWIKNLAGGRLSQSRPRSDRPSEAQCWEVGTKDIPRVRDLATPLDLPTGWA